MAIKTIKNGFIIGKINITMRYGFLENFNLILWNKSNKYIACNKNQIIR